MAERAWNITTDLPLILARFATLIKLMSSHQSCSGYASPLLLSNHRYKSLQNPNNILLCLACVQAERHIASIWQTRHTLPQQRFCFVKREFATLTCKGNRSSVRLLKDQTNFSRQYAKIAQGQIKEGSNPSHHSLQVVAFASL